MLRDGEVKWIPVSTAAKTLGVSTKRVYQIIDAGGMVSMKVDSTVLVSARSVDDRVRWMRARAHNAMIMERRLAGSREGGVKGGVDGGSKGR